MTLLTVTTQYRRQTKGQTDRQRGVTRISHEEGMKLRENNFRVTQKCYETHAIKSDKAIGLHIFLWTGNHIESNVRDSRVCAALE